MPKTSVSGKPDFYPEKLKGFLQKNWFSRYNCFEKWRNEKKVVFFFKFVVLNADALLQYQFLVVRRRRILYVQRSHILTF
jgi:hypothetical protein